MTTAAYRDVLTKLVSARRFGMKLGLERMRELLDRLGAPDRRLGRIVHVGGTNGKGSTVAMIAALARSGGSRVATYTSPHLSTLRERIVIDGELVAEAAIVEAYARVAAAGGEELTFFEQLTAIAFLVIADAGVDISVIEVGLGGRLDATNVVAPALTCITGVALDHESILGSTLEAIAAEKAGIAKPGVPMLIGTSGEPEAVQTLHDLAWAAGARPVHTPPEVPERPLEMEVPDLALIGPHQRRNAALAVSAVRLLDIVYDPRVLASVKHQGRFEVAGDLILDGAHNPHGAQALAATLRDRGLRPVLVIAVSADKDARAIAAALVPEVTRIIATRYQQERALAPEALADVLREAGAQQVETAASLEAAVTRAREIGGPILVAGSLFLVGEARSRYLGAPTDPFVTTESLTGTTTC